MLDRQESQDLSLASISLCSSGVQLPVSSGIRHGHSLALEPWLPMAHQQKARGRHGSTSSMSACLMGLNNSGMTSSRSLRATLKAPHIVPH